MLLKTMYIILFYDNIIVTNDVQVNWCWKKNVRILYYIWSHRMRIK